MTKDHWMYIAIAAAAVAGYLWYTDNKTLKALKGVPGLPADVQKRVNAA